MEYFYDCDLGNYHYGPGHPMRPHRVRMTHNLIVEYGLYTKMNIFRPELVSAADMTRFHSDDYIHFLRQVTPDSMGEYFQQLTRFNIGHDCPVFDGLFDYCRVRSASTLSRNGPPGDTQNSHPLRSARCAARGWACPALLARRRRCTSARARRPLLPQRSRTCAAPRSPLHTTRTNAAFLASPSSLLLPSHSLSPSIRRRTPRVQSAAQCG